MLADAVRSESWRLLKNRTVLSWSLIFVPLVWLAVLIGGAFIDAKVDTGKVTGANVSIKIDDEFMRAAIEGKPYHQQFPINSPAPPSIWATP